MKRLSSQLIFSTFLLFTSTMLLAGPTASSFNLGDVLTGKVTSTQQWDIFQAHPFVALHPSEVASSPDPFELRIQDLRGNVCFPQPDQLQVCGLGDTLSLLFFTKSDSPLEEINLEFAFDDGIEYGGFAMVDTDLTETTAVLTPISDENPEAPTFLVDAISATDGAVILNFGIRAECGVDFSTVDPGLSINVSYINSEGVTCTAQLRYEGFGGDNILTPQVEFTGGNRVDLTTPGGLRCINLPITQTTDGASATGYIFTADNYGFDIGITIGRVSVGGTILSAGADYTIDPVTGKLELIVNSPTADGLLAFGESENVQLCYTYTDCFPGRNVFPTYTVVDACDGVKCTGPGDISDENFIRPLFSQNPTITAEFMEVEAMPNACSGDPYVFDIVVGTSLADPLQGEIRDLRFNVRRCKIVGLGLSKIEVIGTDGTTVVGELDMSSFTVSTEDELGGTPPVPTLNRAGTFTVDLRNNVIDLSAGNLIDADGDGNFDDYAGGTNVRFRFTLEPSCTDGVGSFPSCSSVPNTPGGDFAGADCQISEVQLFGASGCGSRSETERVVFDTPGSTFMAASSSVFNNTVTLGIGAGTLSGYNFGATGDVTDNMIDDPVASTQNISFTYTLDDNDLIKCSDGNTESAEYVITIQGLDSIIQDFVFDNYTVMGASLSLGGVVGDDRSTPGELILTIPLTGGLTAGTMFTVSFDATLDVSLCTPPALLPVSSYLRTNCNDACNDCLITRTCSNTFLEVDPDYFDCMPCNITTYAFIERVSTGYEDNTRTTDVDIDDVAPADKARFFSGDTLSLTSAFVYSGTTAIENEDLNDRLDLFARFTTDPMLSNARDPQRDMLSIIDFHSSEVARLGLFRNGSYIDIGAAFSGLKQGNQNDENVLIGGIDPRRFYLTTDPLFYKANERPQPAFPNGGSNFGFGELFNADASELRIIFYENDPVIGSTLPTFFSAIGGAILPGDSIIVEFHTPMVENPVSQNLNPNTGPFDFGITSFYNAEKYSVGTSGASTGVFSGTCSPLGFAEAEFANPDLEGTARIEYEDCEAILVASFKLEDGIPAGWFADEYRLVAGLEQFTVDVPEPYYFCGGATWQLNEGATNMVDPSGTAFMDTLLVGGQTAYVPAGAFGNLIFSDAEFLNGVRPIGYSGYYNGLNDATTIGGTFPILGYDGTSAAMEKSDSLTFRIPLKRACGAEPTTGLRLSFNAANKYLPDLRMPTYISDTRRQNFQGADDTETLVVDNDGNRVPAELRGGGYSYYFPFQRLDGPYVNRERQTDEAVLVTAVNAPMEILATTAFGTPTILDAGGGETNTYTLTPDPGQTLVGSLAIIVDKSVDLTAISGDATMLTTVLVTDSTIVYAVPLDGLAADEVFDLVLTSTLLVCDAGKICITPLLGCPVGDVAAANQVSTFARASGIFTCDDLTSCYNYLAGSTALEISFEVPFPIMYCTTEEFSITYSNTGTSDLLNFDPVVYLPTGVTLEGTMTMVVLNGAPAISVANPAAVPADDAVYGSAFRFVPLLNGGTLAAGDVLTITFEASTDCDLIDGSLISSDVDAENQCEEAADFFPSKSGGLFAVGPMPDDAGFDLEFPEPLQLSCGDEPTKVLLTGFNTGKDPTGQIQVVITVPNGIEIDPAAITVVAPSDFMLTAADIMTDVAANTTTYTFMGPNAVPLGSALCLELPILVSGDLECGLYEIIYAITQEIDGIACPGGPDDPCTIRSLLTESPFLPIEVVAPAAFEGEPTVTASCGAVDGQFDVNYSIEITAPSKNVDEMVLFTLYKDTDGDGELDITVDEELSGPQSQQVTVALGESTVVMGTFMGIAQEDICPLLIQFTSGDCACAETVLPVGDVLPDFLSNLGTAAPVCPGGTGTIEGICADLGFAFVPPQAGFATQAGDVVTYGLNPGFTAGNIVVSGAFGSCSVMETIQVEALMPFEFGPYNVTLCSEGSAQVDLGIPIALMEDLSISITPTNNVDDPTSAEPRFTDLGLGTFLYNVEFSLNGGECTDMTTITITTNPAPQVVANTMTACQTGFKLEDVFTVTPVDLAATFTAPSGDGTFTPSGVYPGAKLYLPGPEDIKAGQVTIRLATADVDGPCGPGVERVDFTILLVDCGSFFWDGSND